MAVEGHEDQPHLAVAELGEASRHAEQSRGARSVGVGAGIPLLAELPHPVEIGAHDYVAAEPPGSHPYHVVPRPAAAAEGLERGAQPGVAELPEDVERARAGSRSAEPAALELRSRKIFHLRHQFAGRLGRRPGGGDAGYAQKENKFAEALQFRFDNCLSLQR